MSSVDYYIESEVSRSSELLVVMASESWLMSSSQRYVVIMLMLCGYLCQPTTGSAMRYCLSYCAVVQYRPHYNAIYSIIGVD